MYTEELWGTNPDQIRGMCQVDKNEAGVLAKCACQVACRATHCRSAEVCFDEETWRSNRHGDPCSEYEFGKPGHAHCSEHGSSDGLGTGHKSAREACPAACRACPTRLDMLDICEGSCIRDTILLVMLALLPLALRLLEAGRSVSRVLEDSRSPRPLPAQDESLELEDDERDPLSNDDIGEVGMRPTGEKVDYEACIDGVIGWEQARKHRGWDPSDAMFHTLGRVAVWCAPTRSQRFWAGDASWLSAVLRHRHLLPPVVYLLILDFYIDAMELPMYQLAWAVGLREVLHGALALLLLLKKPLVYLLDLQATLGSANAKEKLCICVFAPWAYLIKASLPSGPRYQHINLGTTGRDFCQPTVQAMFTKQLCVIVCLVCVCVQGRLRWLRCWTCATCSPSSSGWWWATRTARSPSLSWSPLAPQPSRGSSSSTWWFALARRRCVPSLTPAAERNRAVLCLTIVCR